MKKIPILILLAIGVASSSFGAFELVEDFEAGVDAWTIGDDASLTTIIDPADSSNMVGQFTRTGGGGNPGFASFALSPQTTIEGGVGTLFVQAYLPPPDPEDPKNADLVFGLGIGPENGGLPWGNYISLARLGGVGSRFDAYDDNSYEIASEDTEIEHWYNIWFVIDDNAQTTDFYIQSDTDPDFETQTLVYENAVFRLKTANGLPHFQLKNGVNGDTALFDNIYIDTTGANLDNPVPAAGLWETEFTDLVAPVDLDFGTAKDTADDLLRIRAQDFTLEEDSLRLATPDTGTALASLQDYGAGQNFVVESEVTLQKLPGFSLDQIGLVVLGGPHEPGVTPFRSSASDEFYTLSFNPSASAEEPGKFWIRETYSGEILIEGDWEGRSFEASDVFADDFSDSAASEAAWDNEDPWQVGEEDGRNVFATDPGESSSKDRDARLRSPVIDLTGLDEVQLTYSDFHQLDTDINFHSARVSVLRASNPGDVLEELSATTGVSPWQERSFTLSQDSVDAGQIIIEFHIQTDTWLGSDPEGAIAGWSIADFAVFSTSGLPATYALKAEGTFDGSGLTLDFTLSDEDDFNQTVSTVIADPFVGNLFGIGGRAGSPADGEPIADFHDLKIELGDVPAITGIPSQTIFVNETTGPLSFSVFDEVVDPGSLTVTGSSSNTTLVPDENIVIEGEGGDRTVTVTPLEGEVGEATITLTVSGGAEPASSEFLVTVILPDPPTITDIADQTTSANEPTEALAFTVGHEFADPGDLTVTGSSSNEDLVPVENIVIEGEGAERTITVTPAQDWLGEATITLTVADELGLMASTSFLLTVEEGTPPWILPVELTDNHHIRMNYGLNFPDPQWIYNESSDNNVGSAGNDSLRNTRQPIHGFALPELDSFDSIASATYTITFTGKTGNPPWDAQLYIFSPEITPPNVGNAEDIFWASPEGDPSDDVHAVDLEAITPDTEFGPVSITLTREMLEDHYDEDGTPISADGKIWFRWSEGREIILDPPSGVQRYSYAASDDQIQFTINLDPLTENFDEGLDAYTATVILGATRSHETEWETVDGALRLNTTFHEDGAQQHALTRTDVALFVGYEWRATFADATTGPQDIGLYVGAGHPEQDVRADYVNIFIRNSTQLIAHGFAGTTTYGNVIEGEANVDSMFIARTGPNTFDVGWYDGDTRNVLTTRTTINPSVGTAIGFYGHVGGVGIVGSLTSATVELAPIAAPVPGFDAWAGDNIPEGADRSFTGSAAGDGVANGAKFAFGLDPMQPAGAGDLPSVGTDEEGRLTITYRVDMDAEGVSVAPEVALSLDQDVWFREDNGGDAPYVVISEGTPVEGSIYEFTATAMNIEGDPAAFIRVSIAEQN